MLPFKKNKMKNTAVILILLCLSESCVSLQSSIEKNVEEYRQKPTKNDANVIGNVVKDILHDVRADSRQSRIDARDIRTDFREIRTELRTFSRNNAPNVANRRNNVLVYRRFSEPLENKQRLQEDSNANQIPIRFTKRFDVKEDANGRIRDILMSNRRNNIVDLNGRYCEQSDDIPHGAQNREAQINIVASKRSDKFANQNIRESSDENRQNEARNRRIRATFEAANHRKIVDSNKKISDRFNVRREAGINSNNRLREERFGVREELNTESLTSSDRSDDRQKVIKAQDRRIRQITEEKRDTNRQNEVQTRRIGGNISEAANRRSIVDSNRRFSHRSDVKREAGTISDSSRRFSHLSDVRHETGTISDNGLREERFDVRGKLNTKSSRSSDRSDYREKLNKAQNRQIREITKEKRHANRQNEVQTRRIRDISEVTNHRSIVDSNRRFLHRSDDSRQTGTISDNRLREERFGVRGELNNESLTSSDRSYGMQEVNKAQTRRFREMTDEKREANRQNEARNRRIRDISKVANSRSVVDSNRRFSHVSDVRSEARTISDNRLREERFGVREELNTESLTSSDRSGDRQEVNKAQTRRVRETTDEKREANRQSDARNRKLRDISKVANGRSNEDSNRRFSHRSDVRRETGRISGNRLGEERFDVRGKLNTKPLTSSERSDVKQEINKAQNRRLREITDKKREANRQNEARNQRIISEVANRRSVVDSNRRFLHPSSTSREAGTTSDNRLREERFGVIGEPNTEFLTSSDRYDIRREINEAQNRGVQYTSSNRRFPDHLFDIREINRFTKISEDRLGQEQALTSSKRSDSRRVVNRGEKRRIEEISKIRFRGKISELRLEATRIGEIFVDNKLREKRSDDKREVNEERNRRFRKISESDRQRESNLIVSNRRVFGHSVETRNLSENKRKVSRKNSKSPEHSTIDRQNRKIISENRIEVLSKALLSDERVNVADNREKLNIRINWARRDTIKPTNRALTSFEGSQHSSEFIPNSYKNSLINLAQAVWLITLVGQILGNESNKKITSFNRWPSNFAKVF